MPILEEVLQYQPDLVIFCEGHNEFLEERDLSALRSQPAALAWAERQASRLRTYNVLRDGVLRLTTGDSQKISNQPRLGPEVDAPSRLERRPGKISPRRSVAGQRDRPF